MQSFRPIAACWTAEIASAAVAAVLGSQAPQLQRVAGSAHATPMAQPTAWDADCVAIRCALDVNVAERTFKGRASVWVRAPRASSLKLHCRGVTITNVEVNGIKTRWRLRDPVAEVSQTKIQGAGALEAAAWLSAAEEACKSGELEIEVPAKVHLESVSYTHLRAHET